MDLRLFPTFWMAFAVWLCGLSLAGAEEFREWKSAAGTSVRAKLISQTKDSVLLELENGDRKEVKKTLLAPATRKMLEEMDGDLDESAEVEPGDDFVGLAMLRDGKFAGQHLVYDQPGFLLKVDRKGSAAIHMKEDGQIIAGLQPVRIWPELQVRGNTGWYSRDVVRLRTDASPSTDAKTLHYEGETDDGVSFHFRLECKQNRILVWGGCQDPDGIEHPTDFRVRVHFVRTHLLEDDAPDPAIKQAVKGSTWEVETEDGNVELDYASPVSLASMPKLKKVSVLNVKPSSWVGQQISVKAPRAGQGLMSIWNYADTPLYRGFSASFSNAKPADVSKRSALEIKIH